MRKLARLAVGAIIALVTMSIGHAAEAQALRVMPVPWVANDTAIPHQAYNGHATTFKAIARGGNGTYVYEWDFEGDGVYDFTATTTNRYNLSTQFTYPNQATTTTFQAKVRVTSNGQTVVNTYPVRVFADVPADPSLATERQIQVMRSVSVDDALWFLHTQMTRSGNEEDPLTGAQITGNLGTSNFSVTNAAAAGFLWSLSLNGHYAAFPAAYIGTLPNPADNTNRWNNDPYAEDAARLVNYLLTQMTVVSVTSADESNLTGFYPEVSAAPIFGTDDGIGLQIGYSPGDLTIYPQGHALAAFSVSRLGGYVAQVGDSNRVLGRRFEFILQQMVDATVWAQNEGGIVGSWYYTPNSTNDDLSTSLWGMTGLWHADEFAKDQGVIVPNLVKTRLIQYVQANANACPAGGTGGSYTTAANGVCDFTTSAGHLLALGWVGANKYSASDTRLAFPSYNGITFGQLRSMYDSSMLFITNAFTAGSNGQNLWNTGFVEGGNFARTDGHGNHYGMLHWQDAARASQPAIVNFGNNDWSRLFSRYLINNQAATGDWNWVFNTTQPNSDNSGGPALRAEWAILVLSPDALPPLAIAQATPTTAPEGTPIAFNGSSSDPGTGNPIYTWAFGNGQTLSGQNVTYAYPDNGNYNVTLTSTSAGGTSVDTIPIVITNVAPTANAGADVTVNEGSPLPFNVTYTDPGIADTFTFGWDFGDGSSAATQSANHTYADNGVYNAVATVTDDDGGVGTDARQITVNNVAPTITSTPGTTATEGSTYDYTLTFTDPGTADTHVCSAPIAPAGSTLNGCDFTWTPNFAQAIGSAAPVTLCVTDDDGGQTCQSFTITVAFVDTDGDGLPDSWEVANFGDLSQDQNGDPDGDGMTNLDEFQHVTDPNTYDGPNAPTTAGPTCGTTITSQQVTLVANNATDPQTTPLYQFELYADASLTVLLATQDNIPEGSGTTTSWTAPVTLQENGHYYWRVRAKDPFTYGPWSTPACDFTVNALNEAPGAPAINMPAIGGQATVLRPDLIVDNATDPDGDTLTYTFEIYSNAALTNLVASQSGVASGTSGTTTWTVTVDLAEDTQYYWRARATDTGPLSGPWSATGNFLVTTVNAAPTAPILVSPQNGTHMGSLRPDLVILDSSDPDRDPLVYDWALATDNTFSTVIAQGADVSPSGSGNTTFAMPVDLAEDTHYCWRARADDGQATSAYNMACFFVSIQNDPPSVPTLNNPSDGSKVLTQAPIYSWAPSTDPEGDVISYEVEVRDGTTVVDTTTVLGGTVASMSGTLENGKSYTWRARAIDSAGAASTFSSDNTFTVEAPIDNPDVVVNGGGCCQTGSNPTGGMLLALGALGLLLRRRRAK